MCRHYHVRPGNIYMSFEKYNYEEVGKVKIRTMRLYHIELYRMIRPSL